MVYGIGKTVYIVAGTNKICPDFDRPGFLLTGNPGGF